MILIGRISVFQDGLSYCVFLWKILNFNFLPQWGENISLCDVFLLSYKKAQQWRTALGELCEF